MHVPQDELMDIEHPALRRWNVAIAAGGRLYTLAAFHRRATAEAFIAQHDRADTLVLIEDPEAVSYPQIVGEA